MLCLYFSSEGNRGKVFFYLKWNGLNICGPKNCIGETTSTWFMKFVSFRFLKTDWLGRKYIGVTKSRNEVMQLLVSEYNATKSTLKPPQ